jgi:hypothetical protein
MLALEPDRKKRIETHYVEQARRASAIFPSGRLEPHEKPDFLLFADHGKIGIEVTELCREEPRAEAGRLSKVPEQAKAIYKRCTDAAPVDVSIGFWRAETVTFNALTKTLAEFVYANRARRGRILNGDFPPGFCHIGVHEPSLPSGHWHATRAFDTVVAPKELIAGRIAEKNSRVAHYRLAAPEVWLLIVNDRFLGPGEVYARSEHLAQWKFPYDFDKVLLFSREPGGADKVIEIQRA